MELVLEIQPTDTVFDQYVQNPGRNFQQRKEKDATNVLGEEAKKRAPSSFYDALFPPHCEQCLPHQNTTLEADRNAELLEPWF